MEKLSLNNKFRCWEMIWKAVEERRWRWMHDQSFREREMTRKAEEEEKLRIDLSKNYDEWEPIDKMKAIDKERYEKMLKENRERYMFNIYRACHLIEYPPITHHITALPFKTIGNSSVSSIGEIQVGVIIHVRHTIQYWCPCDQSSAGATAGVVSTHDDDLQLISSHLLDFNPSETYNLWLDHVFTSDNDAEIMFNMYNQLYHKCSSILSSYKQLEEVMNRISEKKEYVLKERPRHLDIRLLIYFFENKYFQCAEDAYPALASAGRPDNPDFIEFIGMHNERRNATAAVASSLPNVDQSREC